MDIVSLLIDVAWVIVSDVLFQPESIKLNAVIEKTAGFVSTSGVQMEIVLKTKQANNPQFDFLKYDHYLNPYYRHLIIMIKSGKYRPNVDNNSKTTTQKKKSNKNGKRTMVNYLFLLMEFSFI